MTADQIRAEVGRFWGRFTSKSEEGVEEFYAHESSVFGSTATRPEPGRLAATRRRREYFHPETTIRVNLGPVEVMVLGDVGVASYTFELHATNVAGPLGKPIDEQIQHGRATQVFAPDNDGKLRIVHEHFSVPART